MLLLPEGAQIPVETELELHVSDWLRLMEGTGGGSEGRGLPTPKLEVSPPPLRAEADLVRPGSAIPEVVQVWIPP